MALSAIYKDPTRVAQIRNCGPLSCFIESFADYLFAQRYPSATVKCHICAVEGLSLFCKVNTPRCLADLSDAIRRYLESNIFIDKENKTKRTRFGLNRFVRYMTDFHGLLLKKPTVPYQDVYEHYQRWQRDVAQLNCSNC